MTTLPSEVKAALREKLSSQIDRIIASAEQVAIDDKGMYADMDNNLMNRQTIAKEILGLADLLQPEIERLVVNAEVAENNACQQIVQRLFGTREQLHEMQRRIANKSLTHPKQQANAPQPAQE